MSWTEIAISWDLDEFPSLFFGHRYAISCWNDILKKKIRKYPGHHMFGTSNWSHRNTF